MSPPLGSLAALLALLLSPVWAGQDHHGAQPKQAQPVQRALDQAVQESGRALAETAMRSVRCANATAGLVNAADPLKTEDKQKLVKALEDLNPDLCDVLYDRMEKEVARGGKDLARRIKQSIVRSVDARLLRIDLQGMAVSALSQRAGEQRKDDAPPEGASASAWAYVQARFGSMPAPQREFAAKVLTIVQAKNAAAYERFLGQFFEAGAGGWQRIVAAGEENGGDPAKAAQALMKTAASPENPLGAIDFDGSGTGGGTAEAPIPVVGAAAPVGGGDPKAQFDDVFAKLRAELAKDPEKRAQDVAETMTRYLWERPADGGFVKPELKQAQGSREIVKQGVAKWVLEKPEVAAIVYYGLAGTFPPLPDWLGEAVKADAAIVYPAELGLDPELTKALARWASGTGAETYGDLPIGPLGAAEAADWLAGFFKDASEQTVKILLAKKTSPEDIRRRVAEAWRRTKPDVPGGLGPEDPLAGGSSVSFGPDSLFGKWGDPDVMHIEGRIISVRMIAERVDGRLKNRIAIFDISNPSDIYGKVFDLGWKYPDAAFVLDDRTGGHKKYQLKLTPAGDDVKITFQRPSGTEAKNSQGEGVTLNQLFRLREERAKERNDVAVVGGKEFLVVPYSAGKGCLQYMDRQTLDVALVGCTSEKADGAINQLQGDQYMGQLAEKKHYYLHYNLERKVWETVEKEKGPEPPAAPGGAPGGTQPTGPKEGEGGQQGSGEWPPKSLKLSWGTYVMNADGLSGEEAKWGKLAEAVNKKVQVPETRLYIGIGSNILPEQRWVIARKGMDSFLPLFWLDMGREGKANPEQIDVKDGDLLVMTNDFGDVYASLREPFTAEKKLNVLGSFDKRKKIGAADNNNNMVKVHDLRVLRAVLEDPLWELSPEDKGKIIDSASKVKAGGLAQDQFGTGKPAQAVAKPEKQEDLYFNGSFAKDRTKKSLVGGALRSTIFYLHPAFGLENPNGAEVSDKQQNLADPKGGLAFDSPPPRENGLANVDQEDKPFTDTVNIPPANRVATKVKESERNGAAVYVTEEKVKEGDKDRVKRTWYLRFTLKAKDFPRAVVWGPVHLFEVTADSDPKPPYNLADPKEFDIGGITTDKQVNSSTLVLKALADYKPPQGAAAVYDAPQGQSANCIGSPIARGGVTREDAFKKCQKKQ